ncbi:MAG TPA: sulfite exporter TauE/SafE family protein [Pseudonocardia sp.]|jgi:uncharacterized protein|nr:sulfite exporter TauE/SafE family protein [Pseudonocardia sp.]
MSVGGVVLLVAAGVAAGLSGSIAGLASLFSYPALLAAGLPAVSANVTNTVALTLNGVGSAANSRRELTGQGPALRRFVLVAGLGGATGAALLLGTPSEAFERIVPFLVAVGSVALILQPRLRAAAVRRGSGTGGGWAVPGLFAVMVYGGYFGAAAGVLVLALLVAALPVSLLEGNALKNVLLGVANGVAALGFAVFGPVVWTAVLPLAAGVLAGSWAGPAVARRLPADALRIAIGLAGLGLAGALALQAY